MSIDVENILKSNKKVSEKILLINEYKKDIADICDMALQDVVKGYKICPKCGEYYKQKTFETETKAEMRKVCTHEDIDWQCNEYEDMICEVIYEICPLGHRIEKSVTPNKNMH